MNYRPIQSRILITVQRPALWVASLGGVLLLIAFLVYLAFEYGQKLAGYDKVEAMTYIYDLQQQLEDEKAKNAETQRQAAMLERNSAIDSDATKQLKKSLNVAQEESLELKKELNFYKSIVAPEQDKRSLAVQTIQLKPDQTGGYQYKIMVSQRGRNDRFTRGKIVVTIEGSQDGQAKKLKLSDVVNEIKKPLSFGFKYFQNFEGTMVLPATFLPETMRVQVKPNSGRIDPVDEKFSWADLTAVAGEQNVGQ
mgnify:CR=1 FL=1